MRYLRWLLLGPAAVAWLAVLYLAYIEIAVYLAGSETEHSPLFVLLAFALPIALGLSWLLYLIRPTTTGDRW